MNYELELQRSAPVVFNSLTGSAPPLVTGSGTASKRTSVLSTAFSLFNRGFESLEFSLSVWYLPMVVTAPIVVLGHTDEGILFDGSKFTLRLKTQDGQILEQSWTPQELQSFYLVATYSVSAFRMYANGELVAVLDLPANMKFLATGQSVVINNGSQPGIYDSLALYARSLSSEEIAEYFRMGQEVVSSEEISSARGGDSYSLNYSNVEIDLSTVFDATNFQNGLLTNLAVSDNLVAMDSAGGTWMTAIPLGSIVTGPVPGVHLSYIGYGVTLEYSTNGSTWTATPNNRIILEDAASTDLMLYIRLTLAETSWVTSLTVDVLRSRVLYPFGGSRQVQFKGASLDTSPSNQLAYQFDRGAALSNGSLTIMPDTDDIPLNVTAIEAWMKIGDANGRLITVSGTQYVDIASSVVTRSNLTVYINGQLNNGFTGIDLNAWNHYVFVLTTPLNTAINLGSLANGTSNLDMSVGSLAVHTSSLSAAQVLSIYQTNVGAAMLRVDDISAIRVTESSPATDIFAYAWSISLA